MPTPVATLPLPRRPLVTLFAVGLAGALGCAGADEPSPPPAVADVAPSTGPLDPYVSCGPDGRSDELALPPVALGGDRGPADVAALAACTTTGPQAVAVLYVTWAGATGQAASPADVEAAFFGAAPSLRDYWERASYGQATATGQVFGPYTLAHPYTCSAADLVALQADALAAADPDVDFTQYSRIVIVSPQGPDSGCAIMGTSQLGCSQKSTAGDGTFTASVSHLLDFYLVPQGRGAALAAHELGHALGLGHDNSLDYDLDVMAPVGKAGFGVNGEYGGVYSVMGNAALHGGHYAAPHKARLGWLDGRYATVEADGTYHLDPYAATAAGGPQALKIRRAAGVDEWLWLEQRTADDPYDATLDPLAFAGPLVHLQSSATDSRAYVLDLTPATATFRDGALVPGAPLAEPYTGLTLAAADLGPAGVDVSVSYGPPTCAVTAPAVAIAPAAQATAAGVGAAFTVTVTNQDAPSCPTGTFQLSALRPTGWGAGFAPASLQLAPGASASTSFTVTPSATATVGATSSVTARAYRYGWIGGAPASVFVCAVGAAPSVTMTPTTTTLEASFARTFTVTVRNLACTVETWSPSSTSPAWPTTFSTAALTLAPGQTGTFTLTKTSPVAAPVGAYPVDVAIGGGSATATVNLTAPLTRVTTTVPGGPFSKNQALSIVGAATYGSGPVPAGTPLQLVVKRPGGQTQTFNLTAGAAGTATASYVPPQVGTYSAYTIANHPASQWVASAQVTFTVN